MEIDLQGVSKAAAKILTIDAHRYIDYYEKAKGAKPADLSLSAKQWDLLEKELEGHKRTIDGCTFKGVVLRRAQS